MCDEFAQSIEAPPTIWPLRGGTIDAVPDCPDTQVTREPLGSDHMTAASWLSPREAPLSVVSSLAKRSPDQRLAIPMAADSTHHPGYGRDVYRPPRA